MFRDIPHVACFHLSTRGGADRHTGLSHVEGVLMGPAFGWPLKGNQKDTHQFWASPRFRTNSYGLVDISNSS